ncbi:MAG: metalloregulator ArsR/SmtB family transcription factor [Desulfotignum sp.]|nr:metalloregulator ArsR/SmtB family transcription factor [Desulfotignum sp.]
MAMKEFLGVTRALRNSNRVKIMKLLQHGELCVCELQAVLEISQASVSKHLSILTSVGLLDRRKKGLWSYYRIAALPRCPYVSAVLGNMRFWLEDDADIKVLTKKLPDIRRKNLCFRSFDETS